MRGVFALLGDPATRPNPVGFSALQTRLLVAPEMGGEHVHNMPGVSAQAHHLWVISLILVTCNPAMLLTNAIFLLAVKLTAGPS